MTCWKNKKFNLVAIEKLTKTFGLCEDEYIATCCRVITYLHTNDEWRANRFINSYSNMLNVYVFDLETKEAVNAEGVKYDESENILYYTYDDLYYQHKVLDRLTSNDRLYRKVQELCAQHEVVLLDNDSETQVLYKNLNKNYVYIKQYAPDIVRELSKGL